jgi:hypothetical protein
MSWSDVAWLLSILGATCLVAAWSGRKSDHVRDTLVMGVLGGGKIALGIGLWLATG